jgi:DNA-binding IclR family transcriptional regulator
LTSHAQVLLAVAQKSDLRVREIAAATGITERYAYRILRDLERAGYVDRRRHGRSNLYRIHPDVALGDPLVEGQSLWQLLRLIGQDDRDDVDAMSLSRPRSRRSPVRVFPLASVG